jgi:hypothetical protein
MVGESARAYSAFRVWLETEPVTDREYLQSYRTFAGRSEVKNIPGYFRQWIEKYQWTERARQFDNHRNRVEQEAVLKALASQRLEWALRQEKIAEADYQDGESLRKRVREIIALPLVRQTLTSTSVSEDGYTTINHYLVEPLQVRAADAATMLRLASETQRLAAEMATSIVESVDPQRQANKRLQDARRVLAESRERFPDLDENERVAQIAAAFGVKTANLTESDDE